MQLRRVIFVGFLAGLLALTTLLAGTPAPTDTITVGDFATLVAAKVAEYQGAPSPAVAADILKKHGVKLNSDLTSPLTEKDASEIFGQLGIVLQTAHPESFLNRERADSLVGIFGPSLTAAGEKFDATLNLKSSGGAASAPTVETTPFDCQSLPRPPAPCDGPQSVCNPCMECCKVELNLTGKTCGKLCQKKNLVVSPTEPTP
ncbi:MAG: hypothetical protein L0191_16810 [Acidobacteria bacterium]|nr:hypothetical protein [Acidobacteriota bacterium]MCI0568387.1 hypothetical protein [Acidobacteriota bacterium]